MHLQRTPSLVCLFIFIVAVVHAASTTSEDSALEAFTAWAQEHYAAFNKNPSPLEKQLEAFAANLKNINEHNAKTTTNFRQALNEFSSLSFEEFSATHLGYKGRGVVNPPTPTPLAEEEERTPSFKRTTCASGSSVCGTGCCPVGVNYACQSNQCNSCPSGYTICGSYCCPTASTTCVSGSCVQSCGSGYSSCGTGCCPTASNYACISNQCVSCTNGVPCGVSCCPSTYTCTATGCSGAQVATGGPLTPTVNWTAQGYVTPVKNQGECGSCWSFSTTGAVEAAYNIKHSLTGNNRVSLSEQNLIDCSTANSGCNGGVPLYGMQYISSNGGIDTESSYPLTSNTTGVAGTCAYNAAHKGASITASGSVPAGNETALQARVAIQPVSVAICAAPSLQAYKSGVYDDPACGAGHTAAINHAVLIVGYGTDVTAGAYWIVKNSWGTNWGMNGYFLLQKGADRCGVTQETAFPTSA